MTQTTSKRQLILCECCTIKLANDDDSACRDYHGHTHHNLLASEFLALTSLDPYIWEGRSNLNCHGHGGELTSEKFWIAEAVQPTDTQPPTWPENDLDRSLYKNWQYEVSNAHTVRGFREWMTETTNAEVEAALAESEQLV